VWICAWNSAYQGVVFSFLQSTIILGLIGRLVTVKLCSRTIAEMRGFSSLAFQNFWVCCNLFRYSNSLCTLPVRAIGFLGDLMTYFEIIWRRGLKLNLEHTINIRFKLKIGMGRTGFEPATSWSLQTLFCKYQSRALSTPSSQTRIQSTPVGTRGPCWATGPRPVCIRTIKQNNQLLFLTLCFR
jgi:hypothetical protein